MTINSALDWKKNVLKENSKIKDAIRILNFNKNKIVLVEDNKKKLIGTISNGDIRRNLIKGYTKEDDIIYITNKNPIFVKLKDKKSKISTLMIKNKITSIPIINDNKIIKGLYVLSSLRSIRKDDTLIFIMAGGKGRRLLPLTKKTPKPMLKIGGKPMVERIISKASKEGFRNFVFSVNYLSKKIINYFKDGKRWGVKINYVKEKKPLGTIGSLALLDNSNHKNIIVINCDVITRLNLNELLIFHKIHNQIATVSSIIHETKSQFGIIKTRGSRLIEMVEKPIQKNYVNGGIYVFKSSIIQHITKNKKKDVNDLFKSLIKKDKKIIVYPLHEPWADIGVIKELNKVRHKKK
tara:strand:- start:10144 stop:11196 length:1053 start_codon:yes stop_codon:yes gene_type:complete